MLKKLHFLNTVLFVLSACFLWTVALLNASKSWWVIVSLSGYSAIFVFLLISLYLFAIFRGVARSQKTRTEHPLTTSAYYLFFYDISPFLGALAGGLTGLDLKGIQQYLLVTATGTLWVTFLVWIIVDPLAGLTEMLLPSSRKSRKKRIQDAKAVRKNKLIAQKHLLTDLENRQRFKQRRLAEILQPYAEKLALMLADYDGKGGACVEFEAIDIGTKAWQIGGLDAMCQLRFMATELFKQKYEGKSDYDYISIWWDGIGSWRYQLFDEKNEILLCKI